MEATQVATQQVAQEATNAASMASNAIPPTPATMAAQGMNLEEGGDAPEGTSDGSRDWGQWIAIGIISLTIVSLVMQIYVQRKTMMKLDKDDESMKKDINELKYNLKKNMGSKYEELP